MAEHDPARLAALDQQLAEFDARMERGRRRIVRADWTVLLGAALLVIYALAVRQPVSYWYLIAAAGGVALGAAGSLVQDRLIRDYRAEIRELRSGMRVPRT